MIVEYHRPTTLEEAQGLLQRAQPKTIPLGGGTTLSRHQDNVAVVDLQSLGLNTITIEGQFLHAGAAVTIQSLFERAEIQTGLREALYRERSINLRRVATLAGAIKTADGRSSLAAAMLALDCKLSFLGQEETTALSEWLPLRPSRPHNELITQLTIPLNAALQFEVVARTPLDLPQVLVARAVWPSGRNRVVIAGFGDAPRMVLDGAESDGAIEAVGDGFSAANDQWASAAFRQAAGMRMIERMIQAGQRLNRGE